MLYTGVGPRKLPQDAYDQLYRLGAELGAAGWTLRSGGADGADTAFESGARSVGGAVEIYLPWKGFNGNPSPLYDVSRAAIEESLRFHPAGNLLTHPVKRIMGRNLYQVLGQSMDVPSKFLLCWTHFSTTDALKAGSKVGGTGQAIRIACHHKVPIYNMAEGDEATLYEDLKQGLA